MTATRLRHCLSTFSVLLCVMQWAAVSAQAQIPVTTCGTEITQPGQYIVANDLLGCSGNGIVIRAEGVTLNLNGHQIVGVEAGGSRGISVLARTLTVVDGPGTVARFFTGVYLDKVRGGTVINGLTVQDNHFGFFVSASRDVSIGGSTVLTNQEGVVFFNSSDNHFIENVVNVNVDEGIQIAGSRNEIIRNTVHNNGTYGIVVQNAYGSHDNYITVNTATGNPTFDLAEFGERTCRNTWVNNTFNTANLPCIH